MRSRLRCFIATAALLFPSALYADSHIFTPEHVAKIRSVSTAEVSPDGKHIAYLLSVPRAPFDDENGGSWSQLHVVDTEGRSRPFITGEVNVASIAWTPDGRGISFLAKRGSDEHKSLYVIPIDGGEARNVLSHETAISSYSWSPDGRQVAFIATEKEDKDLKKLKDEGFNAEIYEEDFRHKHVWIGTVDDDENEPRKLDLDGSPSELHWSPAGDRLVLALAPTPLIDDHYMFRRVFLVDPATGDTLGRVNTVGKLGAIRFSPDGKHLALITAADLNDPSAGRLMVVSADGGDPKELIADYEGQVSSFAWQDGDKIKFLGDEGCHTVFGEIDRTGSGKKLHVEGGTLVMSRLSLSADGQRAALLSQNKFHPNEVFTMTHGEAAPTRLTTSNPWLNEMSFAKQEVITFKARDGLDIQGILIRPLNEEPGTRYPLILTVHGGPEAHERDGWLTVYSRLGQVAAARGFAVFYPNYRGSTGRGVEFSKMGQADYAGGEFNDLIDAVDHLVEMGLVDKNRVGVTGGSYGGFATAWCSTYHSERFAAGCMFVGISDHISKSGTTDIPEEMYLVHARTRLWDGWQFFLERSPVYHVTKARTPLLILHGKNDTRVHPSQSMELYRHLKTLGNAPVRLVFYPGEGHGNRKSAGRYDYNLRTLRWFEHYLKGPGGTPPPWKLEYPLDESEDDKETKEPGDDA
ncbi:MAG: prolyl oligopeptidase family serine peptidase [Planctomycetota bacterium]|jgi:dipeptidyl aminopeptidase/acylaminoacyl peptidase